MKIGHLELFVLDPLRSMTFYKVVLGCSVTAIQENQFVWLQLGEQEILLRPGPRHEPAKEYAHGRVGIVLYTDALKEAVAQLQKQGVEFNVMPGDCYTFVDPDGHWFQLVDPTTH